VRRTGQESKEGTDLEKWKKDRKSRINSTWKRQGGTKSKRKRVGGRMGKKSEQGVG
jgi:hypothetical protein